MTRAVYRFRLVAVCLGLVALALLQESGRVAADTKLDLTADPTGLLTRALHLWDASGFFGQVQNQAYGYLWPVGPFFAGLEAAQVVPWVTQRLWWSLILLSAFLGVVRMSRLLGVRSPWARVLAGLSYALSVRFLTELTTVSVEAWPMALAPWTVIPLICATKEGTRFGWSPRRWAALSALAFLMAGAVNAVAAVAILVIPAVYLVTRRVTAGAWRLMAWWVAALALACLWWLVPLLLLGRYSPPFLDWIEAAAVTTGQNDPTSVLRGASHWVPYLLGASGPVWPAGWQLVHARPAVAGTALVAMLGLAGLLQRRLPERAFLVVTFAAGLTLTGLGHLSADGIGGFGADAWRELLDGPLAPLRNVHKFQPLVTLPLAVGLGHLGDRATRVAVTKAPTERARWSARATSAVAVAAIVLAAWPALTGALVGGRSHAEIPRYWREAADWLNGQDDGRALLVPASTFGVYLWGRTQDEPLQVLGTQAWAVRDAVPLSSAGNIRLLDEVERHLGAGVGSPGLTQALARSGVRWLVVRNDLDGRAAHSSLPILVHQAIDTSPGLLRAATFGPLLTTFPSSERIIDRGLMRAYPAVEVYEVQADPQTLGSRVALRDATTVVRFTGSSEAMPDLADSGLLGSAAAIAAGDPIPPGSTERSIVTDTFRRSEANFGAAQRQYSNTLTDQDPWKSDRAVHDYYPVAPEGRQSEARLRGATEVTASTSGSSPFSLRSRAPAAQPWSALDGDPRTAWVSGAVAPGVGQWWEVRLEKATSASEALVSFVTDARVGSPPTRVRVTTNTGSEEFAVDSTLASQPIPLPGGGPTTRIRLELAAVDEGGRGQGFGIAEVAVAGVHVDRPLLTEPARGSGGLVLSARSQGRESCAAADTAIVCAPGLSDPSEDDAGLDRIVDLSVGGEYRAQLRIRPRPGSALDRFLAAPDNAVRVRASTQMGSDPAVRGQAAADQNTRTTWIASPLDRAPRLTLRLPAVQRVTGVELQTAVDTPASRPLEVALQVNGVTITRFADERGRIAIPAVRTDRVELRFGTVNPVRSIDSATGSATLLPVGITEVIVLGDEDRRMSQPEDAQVPVACGFAPLVEVDDADPTLTSATATVGGILAGSQAQGVSCGETIRLTPGVHRIRVASTPEWTVERVDLVPVPDLEAPRVDQPRIDEWTDVHRTVTVPRSDAPRLLETTENANPGWVAKLDGRVLSPYRVEGWRQAWLLPAGASGAVNLVYEPDRLYRAALGVGLGAALLLVALAAVPGRAVPVVGPPAPRRILATSAPLLSVCMIGGVTGLLVAGVVLGVVLVVGRVSPRRAPFAAQMIGLAGPVTSLTAQVLLTWPERAGVGLGYQVLTTAGPAAALAALAALSWLRGDEPGG